MNSSMGHSEWKSINWPKQGIVPCTLTAGNTVNTYTASPQPAASIDSWDAGRALSGNLVVLVSVASVSTTGTLTVSLRDCKTALTSANGDANSQLVATFNTIAAAGLYYGELQLTHVFPSTYARCVVNADYASVMRFHSIRCTASGADFVFGVNVIYANSLKSFYAQTGNTALTPTWAAS